MEKPKGYVPLSQWFLDTAGQDFVATRTGSPNLVLWWSAEGFTDWDLKVPRDDGEE